MGLVTTAFCLWAEASALQNVDASVVPWQQEMPIFMEGEASRFRLYNFISCVCFGIQICRSEQMRRHLFGEQKPQGCQDHIFAFSTIITSTDFSQVGWRNRLITTFGCSVHLGWLSSGSTDLCLRTNLGSCLRISLARFRSDRVRKRLSDSIFFGFDF